MSRANLRIGPASSDSNAFEVIGRNGLPVAWIDSLGNPGGNLASGGPAPAPSFPVINAHDFGAFGDGSQVFASVTAGSPILTIGFPGRSVFTPSMLGKPILIQGCGVNGGDLWTTVASYQNPGQVTLAVNVPFQGSLSPFAFWGGHDDSAALQAGFDAAGVAQLPFYIPPGVYWYSSPITANGKSFFTPAIVGVSEIEVGTVFVAVNPAITPNTGFINLQTFDEAQIDITGFVVYGASLPIGTPPTPGSEVFIAGELGFWRGIYVANTSFEHGLHLRPTNGHVEECVDNTAQFWMELDGSTCENLLAVSFLFGGSTGNEGGVATHCAAQTRSQGPSWYPAAFVYQWTRAQFNNPIKFKYCTAANGSQVVGFLVTDHCALTDCEADTATAAYVLGNFCVARDCMSSRNTVASYVVSSGEIPYAISTEYGRGNFIVDSSGHKQTVTVPGVTGTNPTPAFNHAGGIFVDNGVTWQDGGVYSTLVKGVLIDNPLYDTQLNGVIPTFGLYNKGTNTLTPNAVFNTRFSQTTPILQGGLTANLTGPGNLWTTVIGPNRFRVDYYIETTTVGTAGTVTGTISWTDDNGAQTLNTSALSLTAKGNISGSVVVQAASGNITMTTTVAGATGSPQYAIYASATPVF